MPYTGIIGESFIESVFPLEEPVKLTNKREQELRDSAQAFKAMSDETRQKILILLNERPLNVTEIVSNFSLAQPTISRHLAVLRHAGLVSAKRSSQHMIYQLERDSLSKFCNGFMDNFKS